MTHVLIDFPGLNRLVRGQPSLDLSPEIIERVREFSRGPCQPLVTDKGADALICRLPD